MAYTDVATLKTYLGVTSDADDLLLQTLITRAQTIIDTYCKRTFEASADGTHYFDAVRDVDGDMLYLDDDCCSITSVTNGDGTSLTSGTHYVGLPVNKPAQSPYYALRIMEASTEYWTYVTSPEIAITVVGRWSYSVTAPQDIVQATVRLAGYLYRQKDNASDLDRPIIAGNATILPASLPSDIRDYLAPYRRMVR